MKYFLDTEFIESGPYRPIQLVSLGIISEDNREFYAISTEYNPLSASDWVKRNVFPFLELNVTPVILSLKELAIKLLEFIGEDKSSEFWGYYADYDWVVFCQIFGTMMDLPKGWPMFCRDLKQWNVDLGRPELPKQSSIQHNALEDAKWNKLVWEFQSQLSK